MEQNISVGRDLQWSSGPNLCRCSRPSKQGDTNLEWPDPFRKPHFISWNTSLCLSQLYPQKIHFTKLTPQNKHNSSLLQALLRSLLQAWSWESEEVATTPLSGLAGAAFGCSSTQHYPFLYENWSPSYQCECGVLNTNLELNIASAGAQQQSKNRSYVCHLCSSRQLFSPAFLGTHL